MRPGYGKDGTILIESIDEKFVKTSCVKTIYFKTMDSVASYPYAGTIRIRFKGSIRRCLRLFASP